MQSFLTRAKREAPMNGRLWFIRFIGFKVYLIEIFGAAKLRK